MDDKTKRGKVYNRIVTKTLWEKVNEANKIAMEDYLLELQQQKKKDSTIKQYKNDLKIILIFILKELDNKSITDCTRKDFRKMSIWFSDELGLSNARINRLLSALRSWLSYLEDDDDYDYSSVGHKIKGLPKEPIKDNIFLSDNQIMKLKEELLKRKEYQLATLLMLAYDSGGRRNELAQVNKENFLNQTMTNEVIGKRGKKFKLIYFSETVKVASIYLEQRGEDNCEALFIVKDNEEIKSASYMTLYNWFIKMSEILSEIEGVEILFTPHSLRHSALENLSTGEHYVCKEMNKPNGFDILVLKAFAHHSDTSTTEGYLKDKDYALLEQAFCIKME